jgi:hypothetical protein
MSDSIPPELEMLSRIVDGQAPAVRELFQYALVMLLTESGKASLVERHVIDLREHLTFRTIAGETFTLIKPAVDQALLDHMMELAREVLKEEPDETT